MFREMQLWMQNIIENMKLTDYRIGTVVQLNPTKIDFGDNKIITDVGTNIFYTESVIEKKIILEHTHKIDTLGHNHEYGSGNITAHALDGSYSTLESLKTYIITEGIKKGDKLLMLRVANGQKFIVLSKLRDTNSIIIS